MKRHTILLALATSAVLSASAQAQVTSAQQSAIRSNCRSDFMSHCSGVTPGGKDALMCLQKNVDKLSGACQTAVRVTIPAPAAAAAPPPPPPAVAPPPPAPAAAAAPPPPAPAAAAAPPPPPAAAAPPAAAPKVKVAAPPPAAIKPAAAKPAAPAAAAAGAPTAEQQSAMRANCRNDFMAKCAGVQPGGKEALSCLQGNVTTLSASCKKVVAATMGAPAAAPAPAAVAMPAAPAPAGGPDPAKLKALKFTCRSDFRRLCKNVPEGPEAFACLQANSGKLSPNCKTSLADVAASMPEGGAMPPATPAAIKPAPVPHPPKAPVIDAAAMIRGCKLDMVRHCRGVGVGDGKMIACLTAHEADLTIRCRTLFKITSPLH
jgi:hypothetical protein